MFIHTHCASVQHPTLLTLIITFGTFAESLNINQRIGKKRMDAAYEKIESIQVDNIHIS